MERRLILREKPKCRQENFQTFLEIGAGVNIFVAVHGLKLVRSQVCIPTQERGNESNATEYKAIVEKLGSKLNALINGTKA